MVKGGREVVKRGKSFQQNQLNNPVGHEGTFLQTFSLIKSNSNFRYQHFVAVSGNLGGKVPIVDDVLSSHEQEIYPTTSLDENCIEFKLQTDLKYYVDLRQSFLALKLKFVKGRGYDIYESKEKKRRTKMIVVSTETGEDEKKEEEEEEEEKEEVARVTYVNNIMHSIFRMWKCTLTINRFTIPMDSMHTSPIFQTNLRQPSLNTMEFCIVKAMTISTILRILITPYLITFLQGE